MNVDSTVHSGVNPLKALRRPSVSLSQLARAKAFGSREPSADAGSAVLLGPEQ